MTEAFRKGFVRLWKASRCICEKPGFLDERSRKWKELLRLQGVRLGRVLRALSRSYVINNL